MKIENLKWDSDFFGYPVGKLCINEENSFDENLFNNSSKQYKLVYIFSEFPLETKKTFLKHVDNKVTFKKELENKLSEKEPFLCTPFENINNEYDILEKLAMGSGKYSRFRTDEKFHNNEFGKLYNKWIQESINKVIALEVLVFKVNNKITGFITVSDKGDKLAQIGLIAVSSEHQGKGIGSMLIRDAEKYVKLKRFINMQVVTQQKNENGMNLYIKNGYKIIDVKYVYHFWNV